MATSHLILRDIVESFREKPIEFQYSPKGVYPKRDKYTYRGTVVDHYRELFEDKGIDMDSIKAGMIYKGNDYLLRVVSVNNERVQSRILVKSI